jgi:hypothetical protein
VLYWHKIALDKDKKHQSFSWVSNQEQTLKAIACSSDTELSLSFENGKSLMFRQFENRQSQNAIPIKRTIIINKTLKHEIILGVLSNFAERNPSIYFLVEK